MQEPMFASSASVSTDSIAKLFSTISQNILVVVFGLLPLFFIPSSLVPFDYTKTFFVIAGILVGLIFFSLGVLRSGTLRIGYSYALVALWGVAIITAVSALLSGDLKDSFVGNAFDIHTASFVGLMALVATVVMLILGDKKASVVRMYMILMGSALALGLYHILRILVGAEVLSLGVFTTPESTPLGGWNDLALFFGLILLLSLVALEQLSLTKWGRVLFGVTSGISLIMLAVVNFFAVWLVLGLISLIVLIYGLSKERLGFAGEGSTTPSSATSMVTSAVVFIVSAMFVIGGSAIGGAVNSVTGINYIEVRPSLEATVDIARGVYTEQAFLGAGPNKFVDAWREYKDPAINTTIFWQTDFAGGSGYIPTLFVNTGVFGTLAVVAFLGLFMLLGFRMLLTSAYTDKLWYFIGTVSFVSTLYILGLSLIYIPSATILLLGALMIGVTFAAHNALNNQRVSTLMLASNRRMGFVLIGAIMVVIIGSVSTLYFTGRHYSSTYTFTKSFASIQDGATLDSVEQQVAAAFSLSENDVYARQIATYQLARINSLLNVPEPTAEQQQQFQNALVAGVNAGQLAVDQDATEPLNWATLGSIYSALSVVGIEGSYDRAKEAFQEARNLDPQNPAHVLLEAQLESRNGNLEEARRLTEDSIRLKSNYSDALFFLSQIDVATGNVEGAIAATEAVISLDRNNPTRYYQLGVLESSRGNVERAAAAFEAAVARDTNFANARYFLALAYVDLGRIEEAAAQLEVVADLNPDNTDVRALADQLKEVGTLPATANDEVPVSEAASVSETEGGQVTASEVPDTPLVTPLNPGNDPVEEESEATSEETEAPAAAETDDVTSAEETES